MAVVELLESYGGYKRTTEMSSAGGTGGSAEGWSTAQDEHGTTYYWHNATGESRWEPPPGWSQADGLEATSPARNSPTGGYGSPVNDSHWGGGEESYWGSGGGGGTHQEEQQGEQQWGEWATESYEYTSEWDEYWKWYGYEQQEEAPRGDGGYGDDGYGGYYDDNGVWIDTSGGYFDVDGNWIEHYDGGAAAAGNGGYYGTIGVHVPFLLLPFVVAFLACIFSHGPFCFRFIFLFSSFASWCALFFLTSRRGGKLGSKRRRQ